MTELTDNTQNTSGNDNTGNAQAKTPAQRLQEVERKIFTSVHLEAGQEYLGKVMELCRQCEIDPVFNFDTEADFPEFYGLAIIPLSERVEGHGNVTKGIAIAAIPDYAAIVAKPEGAAWIAKQASDNMLRQVATACKSKEGQANSIPFSVIDFSTSSRASGLAGFNHVASLYVKALKAKGLKLISKALLRQILASKSFAEQQYPRLPQDNWLAVLNSMIQHAEKDSIDVSGLRHWINTRDTENVDMGDIDLSDIDSLV